MSVTAGQIVLDKINATPGCDGLCNEDCGCGLEDFAPCQYGPYYDCELSKRNDDGIYVPMEVNQ